MESISKEVHVVTEVGISAHALNQKPTASVIPMPVIPDPRVEVRSLKDRSIYLFYNVISSMARANGEITLSATGDAMVSRELQHYNDRFPQFEDLTSVLEDADVTIANLEAMIHDYEDDPFTYSVKGGGTYMRAPPSVLDELSGIGCNMFTVSHNHTMDYGYGGMFATMDALESRGLPYAGLGRNLYEARKPDYLDTSQGRIALLSAGSLLKVSGMAAEKQTEALPGSPGVSPLHKTTVHRIPESHMGYLQEIGEYLNVDKIREEWLERGHYGSHDWLDDSYYHLSDMKFQSIEDPDDAGIYYELNEKDESAIRDWIGEANRKANLVVMGYHYHTSPLGFSGKHETPEHVQGFARRCIDAGADAFVGTGPHKLRGVEVYEGKPIFYSLGNFIDHREHIERFPVDLYERFDIDEFTKPPKVFEARWTDEDGNDSGDLVDPDWWRTFVPRCTFDADGTLERLEIYPIDMQQHADSPHRGTPLRAKGEVATEILDQVEDLSNTFGLSFDRADEKAIFTR